MIFHFKQAFLFYSRTFIIDFRNNLKRPNVFVIKEIFLYYFSEYRIFILVNQAK